MIDTKKTIGISFATQYAETVIQFIGVLVLARVLSPHEIGTFSVAAFMMALLHVFRDFGVVQYIISEQNLTNEKIRSAIGVAILLALMVAAIMLACSGAVARFYGNPELERIMQVMAASFAISPFGSLLIGIYRREFRLKACFAIRVSSSLGQVAVSLVLAMHDYGALSLAWGNFAGILAFGIVANAVRTKDIPRWPRFTGMKETLSYGGVSSLGNAANIAGTNLPDVVIGKAMSMASVGYFSRANGLVTLFIRLIISAVLPLVLPFFAQMRREGKDLAPPYLSSVEQLTALAWPFFAGLMLLGYPMVRALYGLQWDPSVPVMQLMCVAGAVASVSLLAGQVMVANGQVGDSTRFQLYTQPLRIGAVLAAASYSLMWVAGAIILVECVTLLVVSRFLQRTINVSPAAVRRACTKSAVVTLYASIGPALVNLYWPDDPVHPWPPLLVGIFSAAIGWLGGLLVTQHPLADHLRPVLARVASAATRPRS